MTKFWATCCDENCVVFFNEFITVDSVQQAFSYAQNCIPEKYMGNLHISVFDEIEEKHPELCFNIDQHWNKRKQCFPVRVTKGKHNLQFMTAEGMNSVTVEIIYSFTNKGIAQKFAENIGASWSCGAYL